MIPLTVTLNLELDPWTDLRDAEVINLGPNAAVVRIGLLPNGTHQGRAVVGFDILLADGRHVVAETTWRLFHMAFHALAASPIVAMEEL